MKPLPAKRSAAAALLTGLLAACGGGTSSSGGDAGLSETADQCVFQGNPDGDYCTGVSDTLYGPFTEPCAFHDACYNNGARNVVASIEQATGTPITTLSPARREMEIHQQASLSRSLQQQCDTRFKQDLANACSSVAPGDGHLACLSAADNYFLGVSTLGHVFFERSIDDVVSCRIDGTRISFD